MARAVAPLKWLAAIARLAMVLPFLALSLLPQGFMPDRNAAGAVVLVLCTPDGPVELSIDLATGQPVQKAKPAPCHWSVAQAGLSLVQPMALPLSTFGHGLALAATEADLWRPAYEPKGIWARGPPSLI